jgi:hypothetical protein
LDEIVMLFPFINWFLIDLIMGAVAAEEEAGLQLQANRLRASHAPSEDLPPAADPFWRATYFGRHCR